MRLPRVDMPKRTDMYLPEEQLKKLKKLADKKDVSVSEPVRRAIEEFFKKEEKRKKQLAERGSNRIATDKAGKGGIMARVYRFIGVLSIMVFFPSTYTDALDWKEASKQIQTVQKLISTGNSGDEAYMVAWGRWKTMNSKTKYPKMALINATHIFCSKRLRTCQEAVANFYTPEDPPKDRHGSLHALLLDYEIVGWSGDTITAKHETPVADIELRISVKDKVAERSYRETKARGSETSDPNVFQSWILE